MAPVEKKKTPAVAQKLESSEGKTVFKKSRPRNYNLGNGIMRFSRTRVYHKKALYKFVGKKVEPKKKPAKPIVVEKVVGGEKNGGKRYVLVQKRRAVYPTQDKIKKRPSKQLFRKHKRYLRPTLQPGAVLILLAGAHKGKRVVLLKQLDSGLLLITGPFKINGCPLRRISQRYVIGTNTRIDIKDVKLPESLNDEYFKRQRQKRAKKEEGDIFQKKKESYKVTDVKKADQKVVDSQVFEAIRKHQDRKVLLAYLSAMFGLRSSQFPHRLKF